MEFVQNVMMFVLSHMIPILMNPIFWIMVLLVVLQSRQMQQRQKRIFGAVSYSIRDQLLKAIFYGMIGGFIASTLVTLFGITINHLGFAYLWPVAVVLMMLNARFLCFAYAGGLVGASSVLFGWPNIDVPQLLAFIAILHLTESILIYISRDYGVVPLVVKLPDGRHVGAYLIQNLWPLPLIALNAITVPADQLVSLFAFPEWWPMLPTAIEMPDLHVLAYAALPVVAALGYSDMAIANEPNDKRKRSAFGLAFYSIGLLALALLSAEVTSLQLFAALCAPIGHELLIQKENEREMKAKPIFVHPDRGVRLLATVADSPAQKAGLKSGDVITRLNNVYIGNAMDMDDAASVMVANREIEYLRGNKLYRTHLSGEQGDPYGLILVPHGNETRYAHLEAEGVAVMDWLKKRGGKKE